MDRIYVSEEALRNVYISLKRMSDTSDSLTKTCEIALLSSQNDLDETFRKDILKFVEKIKSLNQKIKYCADENMTAISDRLSKISEYEVKTYRKRT